ncbi:MAG: hypothetical protein WB661_11290 [Candidatus Bathyarchaeia archaeon]
MPEASLTLPDGTNVHIRGAENEIARIVKRITGDENGTEGGRKPQKTLRKSQYDASGPTGHIRELVDEGFFKQKRSLGDIQKALEAKGHIYATTSLSPILVRLTRSRILRRLKEQGAWNYVNQ